MNLEHIYQEYIKKDIYPFHMPGHKRNTSLMQMSNPYGIDFTEVDDLDDLHEASAHMDRDGILSNAMRRASRLFGSKHSIYLINGSSGGLVCSILACTCRGDEILIPRNCHKSVYNALALAGLKPIYIYPSVDEDFGIYANLRPEDVEKALQVHPGIKLAVLVSPTFDGIVSDVAAIAETVHAHGIPLLVDEAHGPHLGLDAHFPDSAVHSGADIVVQSLHKTLPVLTQTSILHICSDRIDIEDVVRQLVVIESTSPSYILMASADKCVDLLEQRGPELFTAYYERLQKFSDQMTALKHLRVLGKGNDDISTHSNIFRYDPGKILVSTRGTNLTGAQLYEILLNKYRLQMEMKLRDMVLAMTSIADTQEGFDRLASALLEIDAALDVGEPGAVFTLKQGEFTVPTLTPYEASELPRQMRSPEDAIGHISKEFVYAYPPGIPYIVPGETIEAATIETMRQMEGSGIKLISTRHQYPEYIETCK